MPLILSTGMATSGEIEDALAAVSETGNRAVALLHCASLYPAPPEILNLRSMATMRQAFGVPVGLLRPHRRSRDRGRRRRARSQCL